MTEGSVKDSVPHMRWSGEGVVFEERGWAAGTIVISKPTDVRRLWMITKEFDEWLDQEWSQAPLICMSGGLRVDSAESHWIEITASWWIRLEEDGAIVMVPGLRDGFEYVRAGS